MAEKIIHKAPELLDEQIAMLLFGLYMFISFYFYQICLKKHAHLVTVYGYKFEFVHLVVVLVETVI